MNLTLNSTSSGGVSTVNIESESGQPSIYTDAKEWIWKLVPPIVVILGSFGNGLTIVVLLRQIRSLSSTAVYLLSLAFSDLMILYLGPIRQWIIYMSDIDVRLLTGAGCRTSLFFTYFSFQLSSWLLVVVTTERVISVILPHKVQLGCTTIKAVITVLITVACMAVLNVHFFFGFGMKYNPAYTKAPIQCSPLHENYANFIYNILPWLDFVVAFALPFVILTTGNIVIIVSLKRQANRRRQMGLTTTQKEGRPITVMLIMLCIIFFICLTPANMFFILLPYLRAAALKLPESEMVQRREFLIFIHAVVSCFNYINSTTNFLLYFLSGSRFRTEVRYLLTCQRAGKKCVI